MAAHVAVNDLLEMKIYSYTPSQVAINTFHFLVTDTPDAIKPKTDRIAQDFDTAVNVLYKDVIAGAATYLGTSCQIIRPTRSIISTIKDNTGPGTGGASMAPSQAAAIATWYTNLAGARYRGRTFFPFVPATFLNPAGFILNANLAAYQDLVAAIRAFTTVGAVGATATIAQQVYSIKFDDVQAVEEVVVHNGLGTQRRRGAYGRQNGVPF